MIRVRFAPSPTGYLHIGGVRTALFNFLLARKEKAVFLLRIEDTDSERSKPEFETEIINSLKWLKLNWDEPIVYQSKRLNVYQQYAQDLIARNLAYVIEAGGKAVKLKNTPGKIAFEDLVHGKIEFDTALFEDLVIIKSDGFPTYHFACVVDDHEMKITHVIRGDDHISNTPRQLQLYQAFGWTPPQFGHLPLVFGQDKTPLSKRHGAVSLTNYRNEGFLPDSLLNYLALLGWSPKSGKEFFTLEELIKEFNLESINKTNACFDSEKLKWLNSEHIKALSDEAYFEALSAYLEMTGEHSLKGHPHFKAIALLFKSRARTFQEFKEQASYFMQEKISFDSEAIQKYLKSDAVKGRLSRLKEVYDKEGDFSRPDLLEAVLRKTAESLQVKAGELIHPVRVAVTGRAVSPGIFEVLSYLGREKALNRLQYVIEHFEEVVGARS